MKAKSIEDLGLSDEEMQRMIDGARVAFSHDYGNEYAPGTSGPLGQITPPRQPVKQRSKVKHASTSP
jgi:hypothetical protein